MAASAASAAFCSHSVLADSGRVRSRVEVPLCAGRRTTAFLPSLPKRVPLKSAGYCRKVQRDVSSMAAGDSLATKEPETEVESETPEFVKTLQNAWDQLDDKYAVVTLAFAGIIAISASAGVVSAIDRIPVVPGVLELVGIGYTGWFVYKNLIFKPDREILISKVKCTYNEIIGQ